jgi:predicted phosphodiesterase
MRIAVISDIHGNLTALRAVAADLHSISPDLVIVGGDYAANGARPAEVVDFIRDRGWPGVVGNTDEMLWRLDLLAELQARHPQRSGLRELLFTHMAPFAAERLGTDRIAWLRRLPPTWSDAGLTVLHAAPGNLWRAPLVDATDEELERTYADLGTARVVYAHIHRSFVRTVGPLAIANTGSVSLSYDGDPRAAYAVVDEHGVDIRRVEYDVDEEVRAIRQAGCPYADWLDGMLRTGVYAPPSAP